MKHWSIVLECLCTFWRSFGYHWPAFKLAFSSLTHLLDLSLGIYLLLMIVLSLTCFFLLHEFTSVMNHAFSSGGYHFCCEARAVFVSSFYNCQSQGLFLGFL